MRVLPLPVPFMVAGVCLGAQALVAKQRSVDTQADDLPWSIRPGGRHAVPVRTGKTWGEGADGTA